MMGKTDTDLEDSKTYENSTKFDDSKVNDTVDETQDNAEPYEQPDAGGKFFPWSCLLLMLFYGINFAIGIMFTVLALVFSPSGAWIIII